MRRLVTIEYAFFHDDHAETISASINHARAHASACALAAGNDRVDMESVKMADQRCAPKGAWRSLAYNRFAWERLYLVDNIVAAPEPLLRFGVFIGLELRLAPVRARRHAGAIEAGRVNDRNTRFTSLGEKLLN